MYKWCTSSLYASLSLEWQMPSHGSLCPPVTKSSRSHFFPIPGCISSRVSRVTQLPKQLGSECPGCLAAGPVGTPQLPQGSWVYQTLAVYAARSVNTSTGRSHTIFGVGIHAIVFMLLIIWHSYYGYYINWSV